MVHFDGTCTHSSYSFNAPFPDVAIKLFTKICTGGMKIIFLSSIIPIFGIIHDDVIKWKHFPREWLFVRGIHRSPVKFPHKGQWRGAVMFSLICVWINDWVNNREAGDFRRHRAHYDVIVIRWWPRLAAIYPTDLGHNQSNGRSHSQTK